MCTRPSVEVASRGSQLPRISYRIRAALLLYASPVFDNKCIICRGRDAIARFNAACALLRSRRVYICCIVFRKNGGWLSSTLRTLHQPATCRLITAEDAT